MGAKRIISFGRSGAGKSTMMDEIAAPSHRLIVFDHLPTGAVRARKLKLKHVTTLKQLKKIVAQNYWDGFRIWYQPPRAHQIKALHSLGTFLWNVQEKMGNPHKGYPLVTLYVDEMRHSLPNHHLPAELGGGITLCTEGRHIGVNLLGASQRPAQVNTEMRGNCDAIYFFSLMEPRDFKAAGEIGGVAARRHVETAPPYKFMRIGAGRRVSYGTTKP